MAPQRRNPTITFQADQDDIDMLDRLVRQLGIFRRGKEPKRSQVIRAAIRCYFHWVTGGRMPTNCTEGLD